MSALQRQREQEAKLKLEAQQKKSIDSVIGQINGKLAFSYSLLL